MKISFSASVLIQQREQEPEEEREIATIYA